MVLQVYERLLRMQPSHQTLHYIGVSHFSMLCSVIPDIQFISDLAILRGCLGYGGAAVS